MDTEVVYGNPGTGKTYSLVERIKALHNEGYNNDDIQILSHTRVAAKEIATRSKGAKANTIHSLAYRYGGIIKEQVASTKEIREFAETIGIPLKGVGDDGTSSIEVGDEYLNLITLAANLMVCPLEYYKEELPLAGFYEEFKYFYKSYLNWKHTFGLIDFNDMIKMATVPQVDFKVLFIDEAQDLSPLQWDFIGKMLVSGDVEQVIVTGDPDQALFIWGGADPKGMEKFAKLHKSKITELAQSYRIPKKIHRIGRKIINKVTDRYIKDYKPTDEEGDIIYANSPEIIDWAGYEDQDVLVLYRTHALRREAEEQLVSHGVAYTALNGKPGLLDNNFAKAYRAAVKIQRLDKDVPIPKGLISALRRAASDVGKELLDNNNVKRFLEMGPASALVMPFNTGYYYRDVDVNKVPTIKLSTIHGAKGMEADVVIVLDGMVQRVAEGLETQPDLEHRVWFVAATRAKKELVWVNSVQVEGYPI